MSPGLNQLGPQNTSGALGDVEVYKIMSDCFARIK